MISLRTSVLSVPLILRKFQSLISAAKKLSTTAARAHAYTHSRCKSATVVIVHIHSHLWNAQTEFKSQAKVTGEGKLTRKLATVPYDIQKNVDSLISETEWEISLAVLTTSCSSIWTHFCYKYYTELRDQVNSRGYNYWKKNIFRDFFQKRYTI